MTNSVLAGLAARVVAAAIALPFAASADDAADTAAINSIWESYETARVAGDAESWLSLWDEGGVQMPPGRPARGKDELIVGVPKAFAAKPVSAMEIIPEETVIMGDWAFSRGNYTADQSSQGNDVKVDGKFMTIFRRQEDGTWRIYRDVFNSNG